MTIEKQGFFETVRQSYAPYVDAVWSNFASSQKTWTESLLEGKPFKYAYRSVISWFDRSS